jgi:hypothetical protein
MQRFVGVLGVMVVSACSFEHGSLSSDATTGDAEAMIDAAPLGPWGAPVEVPINSGDGDDDPSLTDDMLEMYFGSKRVHGTGETDENIYVVRRNTLAEAWSPPVEVAELNSGSADTTTKVTGDGLTIFFSSDRGGNSDLYYALRPDRASPWSTPGRIMELSSGGGDFAAFAQKNLKHVVLCAGDVTDNEALYTSDRPTTLEPWNPPSRIVELDDSGVSECDPMERIDPTAHTDVIYYSSWVGNTDKTYDIYRAERASSSVPWSNRTKVDGINTDGHHDRDPWLSADERTMFFSSTRSGSVDKIFMSTR